jgi:2-C-methyl-D-erythritol 4-phosphate cytidylyltransferase
MIEWSLDALRAAGIDHIVVALPEGVEAPAGCIGVRGGATRSESVQAALTAANDTGPTGPVLVHDAARPLVEPSLFTRCVQALRAADCAIAAARVTDTIKQAEGDTVVTTLDRSRLWAVQTPQAFRREALEAALRVDAAILARATDDAWLIERNGGTVRVVESSPANFKVTTPHDLKLAELLLAERA